ncbi:MAG: ROK family protein [Myxococcota bacterium]
MPLLGAIEGGGSKFLCAVGRGPWDVVDRTRIETGAPYETLAQVVEFLRPYKPSVVGVGMFGPLELRRDRREHGSTLDTPKPGWRAVPVRQRLEAALGCEVRIDTDVNAAALAESRWGAAQGADPVVYVTVGTGVGGGAVVHGRPLHGLLHPEMGHVPLPRLALADGTTDTARSACPFHRWCLEGAASGAALRMRLGRDPAEVPGDDPVWDLTARYLAHGMAAIALVLSPERLVLGGGVMERSGLRARVGASVRQLLGGYVPRPELGDHVDRWLVAPALEAPGLAGAFALAGA